MYVAFIKVAIDVSMDCNLSLTEQGCSVSCCGSADGFGFRSASLLFHGGGPYARGSVAAPRNRVFKQKCHPKPG